MSPSADLHPKTQHVPNVFVKVGKLNGVIYSGDDDDHLYILVHTYIHILFSVFQTGNYMLQ